MDSDLPTEYDVIVVGTGLVESIVAAAAARIGKSVLHLDRHDYYGGSWATFNFDGIRKWIAEVKRVSNGPGDSSEPSANFQFLLRENETFQLVHEIPDIICNVSEEWHIPTQPPSPNAAAVQSPNNPSAVPVETEQNQGSVTSELVPAPETSSSHALLTRETIIQQSRRFNIDLAPKLLYARGAMVDLLVESGICRYAEFKSITRILSHVAVNSAEEENKAEEPGVKNDGQLVTVPCSRADIFATELIGLVEKRMLMKILSLCADNEKQPAECNGYEEKSLAEFLESKRLTPAVKKLLLYGVALVPENCPCLEGVARIEKFLKSLGRFGNTPFLWTLYGSGELPQCFSRLCAVFGGIYYLKRPIDALVKDASGQYVGVLSQGQRFTSKHLVIEADLASAATVTSESGTQMEEGVSRAIYITNRSVSPVQDQEHITLLSFPVIAETDTAGSPYVVTVLELGPAAMATPKDFYVVHLTCRRVNNAWEDLTPARLRLFGNSDTSQHQDGQRPMILWACHFNTVLPGRHWDEMQGVYECPAPGSDIDLDSYVTKARDIFKRIYPEEEFLPRAPDPEDIVITGGDEEKLEDEVKEDGQDNSSEAETTTGARE